MTTTTKLADQTPNAAWAAHLHDLHVAKQGIGIAIAGLLQSLDFTNGITGSTYKSEVKLGERSIFLVTGTDFTTHGSPKGLVMALLEPVQALLKADNERRLDALSTDKSPEERLKSQGEGLAMKSAGMKMLETLLSLKITTTWSICKDKGFERTFKLNGVTLFSAHGTDWKVESNWDELTDVLRPAIMNYMNVELSGAGITDRYVEHLASHRASAAA